MMRITMYLAIVVFILFTRGTESGCPTLRISGTQFGRHHVSGRYKQIDRPSCSTSDIKSYQQVGGDIYLFYDEDGWFIDDEICGGFAAARVFDTSRNPEDTRGTWEQVVDGDWTDNPNFKVQCDPGFEGCNQVNVTNAEADTAIEGTYERQPATLCNGRYTYKHTTARYYIYSLNGFWRIGNVSCGAITLIRINNGAFYPEQVSNIGEEFFWINTTHGNWRETEVSMSCATASPTPGPGCPALRVGGTKALHSYVGRYEMLPESKSCAGRPAYQQFSGSSFKYLYYVNAADSWVFGPTLCDAASAIHTYDIVNNPEDITTSWLEAQTDGTFDLSDLKVECDDYFGGCPEILLYDTIVDLDYIGLYKVIEKEGAMCNGRYSYRHEEKDYYVYAGVGGSFYVGKTLCGSDPTVRWNGGAFYPEDLKKRSGLEYKMASSSYLSGWQPSPIRFNCEVPPRTSDAITVEHSSGWNIIMMAVLILKLIHLSYS